MSTDARINTGLPQHPKTKKLIRRLGDAGPWALVKLMLWAASNRPNGSLAGITDEDIELAIDWAGEPLAFIRAAAEVGFLDGAEGQRTIHDWAVHNPWAAGAEARSEKSRWAGLCKQHGRREAARLMPDYADRLGIERQEGAAGTPPAEPESASGTGKSATGTKNSASGTQLAAFSSAPSPSPLPFQEQDQKLAPSAAPTAAPSGDPPARRTAPEKLPAAPDWIDPLAWHGFVTMRRRERHPLTHRAAELIIRKLDRFRVHGINPNDALDQSTRNGWRDVFAPRPDGGSNAAERPRGRESASDRVARINREADADRRGPGDLIEGTARRLA